MKRIPDSLMILLAFGTSFTACSNDDNAQDSERKTNMTQLEAIDLGLPSGTGWCNMNVGATSPEQAGNYYAWGECEPKASYNESNYKHFEKHLGKDIAGTEYDVAFKTLGEGWSIPSRDQISELVNSCTWKLTSLKGTTGYKVTGPNGNSIFLPAAGCTRNSEIEPEGINECGYYWSSTAFEHDETGAYILTFYDDVKEYNVAARDKGLTVRAVRNLSEDFPVDRIWYTLSDDGLNELFISHFDSDISTFGARKKSSGYDEARKMNYISFGSPVTKIGAGAFRGITELTSVIIPDGVSVIEDEAFKGCTSLTSAIIGNGVKSIGMEAFEGCASLTSVTIPDSVEYIGLAAFGSCHSLVLAKIGKGIKEVSSSVFMECCDLGVHIVFTSPQPPVLGSEAFFFIGWSDFETYFEPEILETFKRVIVPTEDYLLDVPSEIENKDEWEHEHPWAFYHDMVLVDPLSDGLDDIRKIAIEEIYSIDVSALDESSLESLAGYKVKIEQAETASEVFSIESDCLKMIANSFKY